LATPNYGYEKRQRELAKRKKKEEKLKSKSERKHLEPGQDPDLTSGPEGQGVDPSPSNGVPAASDS